MIRICARADLRYFSADRRATSGSGQFKAGRIGQKSKMSEFEGKPTTLSHFAPHGIL